MVRESIEIANIANRFMVREGLKLLHERQAMHIFQNSVAMAKRVSLHKGGDIGEPIKLLNNMMYVRVGLSAYIWQHEP